MPDWSYHPFFRPLLFLLPPQRACDLTFTALGTLASLPLGSNVIEIFGHMRAPKALSKQVGGMTFPSAVGLGAGFDRSGTAARAFSQFGFGFIEIGPVTCAPCQNQMAVQRDDKNQALVYSNSPVNMGVDALLPQLERIGKLPVPLGIRLAHRPNASLNEITQEQTDLASALSSYADFFTIQVNLRDGDQAAQLPHLELVKQACAPHPVFLVLSNETDQATNQLRASDALQAGFAGIVIDDAQRAGDNQIRVGPAPLNQCVKTTKALRQEWGNDVAIISAGGITEPQDALDLLDAGADLVSLNSGMVLAGPGLAKRINEAQLYFSQPLPPAPKLTLQEMLRPGWFSAFLLGVFMIFGGMLAWLIAETVVVLPYDEAFVELSRAQLNALNPNILHFMAHDRVTLAGTMLAIGIAYVMLALYGLRYGIHWVRNAFLISALFGFSTFFLFLGFGYFDPLHAVVSLLLLPFFVWSMFGKYPNPPRIPVPSLRNDRRWLAGTWGQAFLLATSAGLIGAGIAISFIGVTQVFVPEDLLYLRISPALLRAAHPNLIPLIAHDRGFWRRINLRRTRRTVYDAVGFS